MGVIEEMRWEAYKASFFLILIIVVSLILMFIVTIYVNGFISAIIVAGFIIFVTPIVLKYINK